MGGQSDSGYGSPSQWLDTPAGYVPDEYDFGYGSPTSLGTYGAIDLSSDYGDTGYGSPLSILLVAASPSVAADEGGQVVRAISAWPITGPYRVELVDPAGGVYPCYGCTPGEGERAADAYTDDGRAQLTFALPPLPVGVYDLRISWVDSAQQTTTVPEAVTIVYRQRYGLTYVLRARFQRGAYDVGPHALGSTPVLGA